jgi:hypothetical protein
VALDPVDALEAVRPSVLAPAQLKLALTFC